MCKTKINILSSGSKGNCCFIKIKECRILIDLGISNKRVVDCLLKIGENLSQIDLICITHEHTDHVSGLAQVLKHCSAMVLLTEGTLKGIMTSKNTDNARALHQHMERGLVKVLKKDYLMYHPQTFNEVVITAVATFHDCFEACGFVIESEEKKIVYITDTGYVHNELLDYLKGADVYVFETNHDPQILMASTRPYTLKMRILSDHGHLSNEDAFLLLASLITVKTKYVFCAHISEECNMGEIITYTKDIVYKKLGFNIETNYVLTSQAQSKVYEI